MNYCTEEGSYWGECCCNCKWQLPLVKHPWNKIELFKGGIMDQIAWVCIHPEMECAVVSERKHSICEMHQFKEEMK